VINWVQVTVCLGEAGCGEGIKEFCGECVYIQGFDVSPHLPDHGVCAVKDLFLTQHHVEEFAVHVVNIVVPRRKDHPVEEVLRR